MKRYKQGRFHLGRVMVLLLVILLVALSISSCGEETKTYRVGVLAGISFLADIEAGFKEGMAELGYVEGENIIYDVQITEFDIPTYQTILQKFVDDDVDLIVSFPTEATIEAKTITAGTDIPVVFTFAFIEGMGIVDTIQEPGGNVTGVRYPGVDIALLRYEMLREIMPDATRIVVPYQVGYPIVPPQLEALHAAAEEDGVTILELPASSAAEVTAFLQDQVVSGDPGFDVILFLVEPLATVPEVFLAVADFGKEYQVPTMGIYSSTEGYASIFGVNVDIFGAGLSAAAQADKVLRGTDPATLPVLSSEPYIEIDYSAAQTMGLEIPETLLAKADEIYR
jgi:putative ABC transport system substrate-binding protein